MLLAALIAAGAYAALRWLLPWLLPFLIAWGAAALLEPLVARLCRCGFGRGSAAGICLLVSLVVLCGLLWLPLHRLGREASELIDGLPQMLEGISAALGRWEAALASYLDKTPDGVRIWLERVMKLAEENLAALPGRLSARLLALLPDMVSAAPGALLFAVTAVIGTYFISASYPELLHGAARLLPERFLCRARLLRRDLRRTLGRWLRAQLILIAINFAVLAAALLLLRVRYALLTALATALIDALPVLGTGTVLLPWAAYEFFSGGVPLGLGLVVTYAVVTVLHQSIQAKLVGDQLGLHPLAALLAVYVGFRVWGVAGMIVFPLLAACAGPLISRLPLRPPWKDT